TETGGASVTSGDSGDNRRRQPSRAPRASKRPAEEVLPPPHQDAAPPPLAPGLYLVATPIGNLGDISLRALEVVRGADLLLCEDTRVTAKLTQRYGIATRRVPYHQHNEEQQTERLIARLRGGERLALVSDAGTPLLSDPGYPLVRAAIAEGLPVTMIPGPAAPVMALALSGLPADRFLFAGFLPPRDAARRKVLAELAAVPAPLLFFECPHPLAGSLAEMAETLGDRPTAIARELTKRFEEVRRGRLGELARHYESAPPRGEIVIVVAPPEAPTQEAASDEAALDEQLR